MNALSPRERFELALKHPTPVKALGSLVEALKSEGMSQREMYRLFDEFREKHHADADETKYDAILDIMDLISGWCTPDQRLFDTELSTEE